MNTSINNNKQHRLSRSDRRHARIYPIGRASGRVLAALAISACLWAPMNSGARAQTYVTSTGSFSPEADDVDHPFRLVEAAVAAMLRSDSQILISPGTYKESFIANKRCILESSGGGVATIGDLSGATTTLKITTLKTHLFGDEVFGDWWQDENRTRDIGAICRDSDWDVVAFQEIWDEDLFFSGDDQPGIWPISGFDDGDHGQDENSEDGSHVLNSGLGIISRIGMTDFRQKSFDDCLGPTCDGVDCRANKGWIEAKVSKGGFSIQILNSHTQAGNDSDQKFARHQQIKCLLDRAEELWLQDSETTVVVMGDLNVEGDYSEYRDVLAFEVNARFYNARDEARHTLAYNLDSHYTSSPENPLAHCFDDETIDARLDYVIVIPPRDESITVIPGLIEVHPFRNNIYRTSYCNEGPEYYPSTNEKSDHWGVQAEIKFFRN